MYGGMISHLVIASFIPRVLKAFSQLWILKFHFLNSPVTGVTLEIFNYCRTTQCRDLTNFEIAKCKVCHCQAHCKLRGLVEKQPLDKSKGSKVGKYPHGTALAMTMTISSHWWTFISVELIQQNYKFPSHRWIFIIIVAHQQN